MVVSASLGTVCGIVIPLRVPLVDLVEVSDGLFRWTAPHPEWKEGDDWGRDVGCIALQGPDALTLIDPLVVDDDWADLDGIVEGTGRPVAVLLTVQWHARSAAAAAGRYPAWTGDGLPDGVEARRVGIAGFAETLYWLPRHAALVSGDLLLGDGEGGVRVAPASWFDGSDAERAWYAEQMPQDVRALAELPVERVLVSHGEPVLSGGREALAAAVP
jgi:hypothetical protein